MHVRCLLGRRSRRPRSASPWGRMVTTGLEEAQALLASLTVPANASVLDLGTGRGWPAWLIAIEGGHRVVGTDVPEGALRLARDAFEAVGVAQRTLVCAADASALPFANDLFDAVTHVDVLC